MRIFVHMARTTAALPTLLIPSEEPWKMVSKNIVGGTSDLLSMWAFLGLTIKYVQHSYHA